MIPLLTLLVPLLAAAAAPRALVIAVEGYDELQTGVGIINTGNDVEPIVAGLRARGFRGCDVTSSFAGTDLDAPCEIVVLRGPLTYADVRDALTSWPVAKGDHLYLQFSGHGQQITDDDGDEDDGYDEALVLVDTPASEDFGGPDYEGSLHLRDDELGDALLRLRRTVGPDGSVAVVLDSCNSGTAYRGWPTRGRAPYDVAKPPRKRRSESGGGFVDPLRVSDDLAPAVVLSASRSTGVAQETQRDDGRLAGALSTALATTLTTDVGLTSWSVVHERVTARVSTEHPEQVPQLEGDRDSTLFDGRRADVPFYLPVLEVEGTTRVRLGGGAFKGAVPGATVEFHDPAAARSDSLVASGTVEAPLRSTHAWVRLDEPLSAEQLETARVARAFVTAVPPSHFQTRVALDVDPSRTSAWRAAFDEVPLVALDGPVPDYWLVERCRWTYLVDAPPVDDLSSMRHVAAVRTPKPGAMNEIVATLSLIARSRLLRTLALAHPDYGVEVTLRPARPTVRRGHPTVEQCPVRESGTDRAFAFGDWARLTIELTGEPAHVSLVHFDGLGRGEVLWPKVRRDWDTLGTGVVYDECVEIDLPDDVPGSVVAQSLKVFVSPTAEGVDFRRLLAVDPEDVRAADGALQWLERLAERTRGMDFLSPGERGRGVTRELDYSVERTRRSGRRR